MTQSTLSLPDGVTQISYPQNGASYNDAQHGWMWAAFEFDVSGPVKITIGGCGYIGDGYTANVYKVENGNEAKLADVNNKTPGCGGTASYEYTGGATTLRVYCGQYCPSLKVEPIEGSTTATGSNKISIQYKKIASNNYTVRVVYEVPKTSIASMSEIGLIVYGTKMQTYAGHYVFEKVKANGTEVSPSSEDNYFVVIELTNAKSTDEFLVAPYNKTAEENCGAYTVIRMATILAQ